MGSGVFEAFDILLPMRIVQQHDALSRELFQSLLDTIDPVATVDDDNVIVIGCRQDRAAVVAVDIVLLKDQSRISGNFVAKMLKPVLVILHRNDAFGALCEKQCGIAAAVFEHGLLFGDAVFAHRYNGIVHPGQGRAVAVAGIAEFDTV